MRRLAADRTLPRGLRIRLILLLGYLASPIDLIPDFIPVLGYADDAVIVAVVLRSVIRHAGADALDRHWPGTPDGLRLVRRIAGLNDSGVSYVPSPAVDSPLRGRDEVPPAATNSSTGLSALQ